jgi:hypothetical protein
MLSCKQATRLFSESQERPLTLREKTALHVHAAMCSGCRRFKQNMHTLRAAAKAFANGANEGKGE